MESIMAQYGSSENPYDLCIVVESPDHPMMRGSTVSIGYETLNMEELCERFKYWNTECKFCNMDIAEAALMVRMGELTHLAETDRNNYSGFQKWMQYFDALNRGARFATTDMSLQLKMNCKPQSIAKELRNRELRGTSGPANRFLPLDLFKKMKISKPRFCKKLCFVKRLLFDHRGKNLIVISNTNIIQVWNLATFRHQNLTIRDYHEIRHIELSSDESILVAGTNNGLVVVWDYKKRAELASIEVYEGLITQLKLSPIPVHGNFRLLTMSKHGSMTMWSICPKNTGDQVLVRTYGHEPHRNAHQRRKQLRCRSTCSFSKCGRYVATTTGDFKIRIYEYNDDFGLTRIAETPSNQESIENIIWAHHSNRFITTSQISHTTVWNSNFKISLVLIPTEETIMPGMCGGYWSADDVLVITTAEDDDRIYVWDSITGTIVRLISTEFKTAVPHPILSHLLGTIECSSELKLWDVTRDQSCGIHTFVVNNDFQMCFAGNELVWSPDGTMLIATNRDGTLIMYDLCSGIPAIYSETRLERFDQMLRMYNAGTSQ